MEKRLLYSVDKLKKAIADVEPFSRGILEIFLVDGDAKEGVLGFANDTGAHYVHPIKVD